MNEKSNKVLSFPSPVPAKADYQRVKSNYSVREIKQLFGLSERTIRRWTEQGIIQSSTPETKDYSYDFHALTQLYSRHDAAHRDGGRANRTDRTSQRPLAIIR